MYTFKKSMRPMVDDEVLFEGSRAIAFDCECPEAGQAFTDLLNILDRDGLADGLERAAYWLALAELAESKEFEKAFAKQLKKIGR